MGTNMGTPITSFRGKTLPVLAALASILTLSPTPLSYAQSVPAAESPNLAAKSSWTPSLVPELYIGWGLADDISRNTAEAVEQIHLGRSANIFQVRTRIGVGPFGVWYLMDLTSKGSHQSDDQGFSYAARSFSYQIVAGTKLRSKELRCAVEPLVGFGIRNEKVRKINEDDQNTFLEEEHHRGLAFGMRVEEMLSRAVVTRAIFTYGDFASPDRRLKTEVMLVSDARAHVLGLTRPGPAVVTGIHFNWLNNERVERIWYFGAVI